MGVLVRECHQGLWQERPITAHHVRHDMNIGNKRSSWAPLSLGYLVLGVVCAFEQLAELEG